MLRRFIWLMPLAIGLFPASVKALPTSPQINQLAQKICQLPSQSPEAFQESMLKEMVAEMGGWMNQGNLSLEEMQDQDTLFQIGNEVGLKMAEICPSRMKEIGNQFSNGSLSNMDY
ncbi:MAG: glutamyl-tRNA amidotransferase [Crocosphaera sp.]|nr:glutamyl-tRNA amidotransferase [Crocosphaera sp.]